MKRLIPVCCICFFTVFYGCSSSTNGELTGVQNRGKYFEPDPHGMAFIKLGSLTIGPSDQDPTWSQNVQSKTITINAFWMDETEITNNEYRQFVYWVRDSIKRRTLALAGVDGFLIESEEFDDLDDNEKPLNWKTKIDTKKNEDQKEALEEMYLPKHERFYGNKEIDSRKLIYEFQWVDMKQAARTENRYDYKKKEYNGFAFNALGERVEVKDRSAFIMKEFIPVYPDTLCWISDFSYSYNEPMTTMYFHHVGYDSYPVVGVNWNQARAFCVWRFRGFRPKLLACLSWNHSS